MIISFNISNFLSYNEEQCFDMHAGSERRFNNRIFSEGGIKLKKLHVLYGSNASGKSNMVQAFLFFQSMVCNGIPQDAAQLYCRTNCNNPERPSKFELTFRLNNKTYTYGFEIILQKHAITKEWLKEKYRNGRIIEIFNRSTDGVFNIAPISNDSAATQRLKIYAEDTRTVTSELFLKIMNTNKGDLFEANPQVSIYRDIFLYIQRNLKIAHANVPLSSQNFVCDKLNMSKIGALLKDFDTGISKINLISISPERAQERIPKQLLTTIENDLFENKKNHPNSNMVVSVRSISNDFFMFSLDKESKLICETFETRHVNTNSTFEFNEESDGTVRLFELIEILLSNDEDITYIVDEIDRCLHPLITKRFIEKFTDIAQSKNVQLITTTHESEIMDLKLLRQDEIGFINKSESGTSLFYSLEKFKLRSDKTLITDYLQGKFAAIPFLSK